MYINLYTLKKIGEKLGVQGNSKQELLNGILNKLEIEIENSIPILPRRVEMVNVLTGEELIFNSTYAAGKYFNKNNSSFIKKMNNGGGIINGYHLLPDRIPDLNPELNPELIPELLPPDRLNENNSNSNSENPSLLSNETNNIFNSVENP